METKGVDLSGSNIKEGWTFCGPPCVSEYNYKSKQDLNVNDSIFN